MAHYSAMTDTIHAISDARAAEIFDIYWSLWPTRNKCAMEMGLKKQKVYRAFGANDLLHGGTDEQIIRLAKEQDKKLFRVDLNRYREWWLIRKEQGKTCDETRR